ncbi:MAG: hypothetical protein M1817_006443 [Caeruleum heppii]|nr:MAG: hypothetical protein M1817_006443 [Caeruleum heppii]
MPAKKWIDKKSATTFALVHREQNDPRLHDASSSSMVFKEVAAPNQKVKTKDDLEGELELDADAIRDNEGEATLHGIYYDDTDYDYMQHMRDIGVSTEGYFVDAIQAGSRQKKGKGKQKLEDALRDTSLEDQTPDGGVRLATGVKPVLLDEEILPSKKLKKGNYQDQQDVPDALAGFQPDMDPRLREVLEALEDEAYVDDEEDVFAELAKDGQEVDERDFEKADFDEDAELDDGWETDDTVKAARSHSKHPPPHPLPTEDTSMDESLDTTDHGDGDWLASFHKFKQDSKTASKHPTRPSHALPDQASSILTGTSLTTNGGRRKKRKGAMTSSTGYSMTSSSLLRTEGLTLLDDRFDKIERQYAEDDDFDDEGAEGDDVSVASSAVSKASSRGGAPMPAGLDSMMDEFLGSYSMAGKKRVKRGGPQTGLDQLDEMRRELGPARVKAQRA